jgi:hypothetical protein
MADPDKVRCPGWGGEPLEYRQGKGVRELSVLREMNTGFFIYEGIK